MAQDLSSDGELLSRYHIAGERAAFAEIVRRHGSMVARVCRQVTANTHDAEDAAQLVFATLAARANALTSRCSVAGWLHTTAWNVAMRSRRERNARNRFERAAAIRVKDFVESGPDVDEISAEVHRALNYLVDDYREPVILHHLEGLTVQEVALRLDCPVGTAASRLSRGRALLRSKLADRGVMPAALIPWLWADNNDAIAASRLPRTPPPAFLEAGRLIAAVAPSYAGPAPLTIATASFARMKLVLVMLAIGGASIPAMAAISPAVREAIAAVSPQNAGNHKVSSSSTADADLFTIARPSSVPEPTSVAGLFLASALLLKRPRRSRPATALGRRGCN
jgi:RNA polymerase sigma factor (sigma-70 family)